MTSTSTGRIRIVSRDADVYTLSVDNVPTSTVPPAIVPPRMEFLTSRTPMTSMFGDPDVFIPTCSITPVIYRTEVGVFTAIIGI